MDLKRIDHRVRSGNIEIWEFRNRSPMPHPMHIHGVQFRIISRNKVPPPDNEQGLKDTVLVDSDETVRLIARFADRADENHPFMFHCHNLEHEDAGMMGQFSVTA
jgi:blue copper oxidase